MNDFDLFLETRLRRMLDPVAASLPPPRGRRVRQTPRPVLVVDFAAEAVPAVEPVPVTVTVAQL